MKKELIFPDEPYVMKMKKEFNLSENRFSSDLLRQNMELVLGRRVYKSGYFFFAEDIKEFIKLLKEKQLNRMCSPIDNPDDMLEIIDKLAGDDLK